MIIKKVKKVVINMERHKLRTCNLSFLSLISIIADSYLNDANTENKETIDIIFANNPKSSGEYILATIGIAAKGIKLATKLDEASVTISLKYFFITNPLKSLTAKDHFILFFYYDKN